jgi:alkanesulfonate monooxygenase SsuD/methylene tetrahydromethanopterin reductase-like flavin-dependent oxidoreductase (luciferase family)
VPFEKRGGIADRYLQILRTLWVDPVSSFEDPDYGLPARQQYPKPVQQPHVPVHIGGNSRNALRRVARFGQGWYAFNLGPAALAKHIRTLDAMLAEQGRARDEITVSVCGFLQPVGLEEVKRYRDAGADQVLLFTMLGEDDIPSTLGKLSDRIVGPGASL